MTTVEVNELAPMLGATLALVRAKEGDDEMVCVAQDGRTFRFFHAQDCCERVAIADIVGDIGDLLRAPLVTAEEVSSEGEPAPESKYVESYTWTFYRFATARGTVTVRWLGESNGYYSEGVSFHVEQP